ncbi:hypothetical protein I8748_00300 [Nostoc sp. CENA67]|uniref:Uncharacterized protein n=1 Tax=Amazonocrinis nigriterrae CENA67 TaxID=2794033 RepID=A0A8J7HQH8_9NOST|nr:hypothetical protein [Amazonocrinis nigriterrae]MBH8560664.1 hypothetical protein [Amazonocrinis nigriterrae CENA67]
MILLLKRYKRLFPWMISGLLIAFLLSLGGLEQKPATALSPTQATPFAQSAPTSTGSSLGATYSDFAATHLEPNFYQY